MTLTFQGWASNLPANALTIDSNGNPVLNFTALNGGTIPISIVPGLFELLDGLAKYIDQINTQRSAATPAQSALTLVSKTIAQYQNTSSTSTSVDPEVITNTFTIAIDQDTTGLGNKAIDPS